jgi:hypothetical protein
MSVNFLINDVKECGGTWWGKQGLCYAIQKVGCRSGEVYAADEA